MVVLIFNIANAFILTSCWNYKETDNLTLVRGFSVDRVEDGNFFISIETADMHQAGTEGKGKAAIIESEGESMFDAVRNAVLVNVPRLYWAHSTAVILSQQVAQEGFLKVLDFLIRDAETRLDIHPFVYRGEYAKEIFNTTPISAVMVSEELKDMLHGQKFTSKTLLVQIYEVIERLEGEGISVVMPAVCVTEVNGAKTIKLCGLAIFKGDKLVGFLDEDETKYFCFATDEVDGGLLVVDAEHEGKKGKITLEILNSDTRFKARYKDDEISIQIRIRVRTSMNDVQIEEFPSTDNAINDLKRQANEQLKKDIENLIKKVQEINSDIFGFGSLVKKQLPKVWKEKGKDWDNNFKELKVEIIPEVEIVHTALLKDSIKKGD